MFADRRHCGEPGRQTVGQVLAVMRLLRISGLRRLPYIDFNNSFRENPRTVEDQHFSPMHKQSFSRKPRSDKCHWARCFTTREKCCSPSGQSQNSEQEYFNSQGQRKIARLGSWLQAQDKDQQSVSSRSLLKLGAALWSSDSNDRLHTPLASRNDIRIEYVALVVLRGQQNDPRNESPRNVCFPHVSEKSLRSGVWVFPREKN